MHAAREAIHFLPTLQTEHALIPFLDLCVSSLREGHANLLCIVPILTDVTEVTQQTHVNLSHMLYYIYS